MIKLILLNVFVVISLLTLNVNSVRLSFFNFGDGLPKINLGINSNPGNQNKYNYEDNDFHRPIGLGLLDHLTTIPRNILKSANELSSRAPLLENLKYIIEDVRKKMHIKNPDLCLPVLDPLYIEDRVNVTITHKEFGTLDTYLENVKIHGFQKFQLKEISISLLLNFSTKISVPLIKTNGFYGINGTIGGLFPVYGEGDFDVNVHNLNADINGKLVYDISIKRFYFSELHINITMEKIDANFRGLYGGNKELEDFFNLALSEIGAKAVNELWPDFEPEVSEFIKEYATEFIGKFSKEDIMFGIVFPPLERLSNWIDKCGL